MSIVPKVDEMPIFREAAGQVKRLLGDAQVLRILFATACLLFGTAVSSGPSRATEIGIIQYNVKGGHGGWTHEDGTLEKQINLIVDRVNRSRVDFVALQQADERPGEPGPIISDRLPKGWRTIVSACNKDTTQLAFSSDWELVQDSELKNPLLDGTSPQRGWIREGCTRGDGRPYNIAFFQNRESKFRILVVVLHFPHCHKDKDKERDFKACIARWEIERFHQETSEWWLEKIALEPILLQLET